MTVWREAQKAEMKWWGNCVNTLAVEIEQMDAAILMGLDCYSSAVHTKGNIVDIGGGPVSLLLKAQGWSRGVVVDPGEFPAWVGARYADAGIEVLQIPGEVFLVAPSVDPDEIWIYNTLQHVLDPELIVRESIRLAPIVRLFEWVGYEKNDCHIHTLDPEEIERWAVAGGARLAQYEIRTTEHGAACATAFRRA
jgi:hypothetical protein